MRRDENTMRRG